MERQTDLIDDPEAASLEWVEVFSTTIPGEPQQRGSKTALVPQKGKKGQTCPECRNPLRQPCRDKFGRIIISMTDSNEKSGPYMEFARGWLAEAWGRGRPRITCPVALSAQFYFERPAGQMGTGKNAGIVKASAPVFHAHSPDIDKLLRCIADCCTKVIFEDDRQVCEYLLPMRRAWTTDRARTDLSVYVPARYAHEFQDDF